MKLAFVAMKFTMPPVDDPVYQRISTVLSEVGYQTIRSDELPSSGVIVEEVCRYLRESDLVIIDTTGDSHSVSYEIGYSHGIARDPARTVLLRNVSDGTIPFNYRHFRHRMYSNLDELDHELRAFFNISIPLPNDSLTRYIAIAAHNSWQAQPLTLAKQLRTTAAALRLSGRLECYIDEGYVPSNLNGSAQKLRAAKQSAGSQYLTRLAIAFGANGTIWDRDVMNDFSDSFVNRLESIGKVLRLDPHFSGDGILAIARNSFRRLAVWDLSQGKLKTTLFPQTDLLLRKNSR